MNQAIQKYCATPLRFLVLGLVIISGVSIFVMIGTTCADVLLRELGFPFSGAVDIVKMASATALATALPYTTAVQGHVAIEFFYHRLNSIGRIVVASLCRLTSMLLFALLSWKSFIYGFKFYSKNQVSQTIELPIFWVPYLIGCCCFITVLVIAYNLFHPNKELIKA